MVKLGKFGNVPTVRNNLKFDSRAEADDWTFLRLREMAGEITDLKRQVTFTLLPAFTDREGTRHRAITWRADFTYQEGGEMVVYECKGKITDRFSIVQKWFRALHPDVRLIIHKVERQRKAR